jgi:hypothetical protein
MTFVSKIRWWLWLAIALTVAKLWLTCGQAIFAIGSAGHDDQLFVKLAESILKGDWLGPYDQLTLAKGPFYSLWIAAVFIIGLPLGIAQQLAYAGSCALVVRALAPQMKSGWGRLAAYSLLLWNPMSFEASSLSRVLRQHVSTPLALLIFAGMIALYTRRDRPFRHLAGWAALLGGALGAFWLTREDGVWIAPSLLLLAGAIVVGAVRDQPRPWQSMLWATLLAAVCAMIPVVTVCWINALHYHWWGAVEFRAGEFKDAYGALLRVKVGPEIPFVPVTRQAREAIYAVSPSFALLKPALEGPIGEGWAGTSSDVTHRPAEEHEIGGGWFMWALRDSVAAAGFCRDAGTALAYYHRLAVEVNQACDDGRLPAGPRRSGFLPPGHPGLAREWLGACQEFAEYLVWFRAFSAYAPASIGSVDELRPFRDLTRDRLAPASYDTEPPLPHQSALDHWKVRTLQAIGRAMRGVCLWLILAAQCAAAVRLVQLAWRRRLTYAFVLAAAAWGACAAMILMGSLVHVTSFPSLSVTFFDSAYPTLLLFVVSIFWDVGTDWRFSRWRHGGRTSQLPVDKVGRIRGSGGGD